MEKPQLQTHFKPMKIWKCLEENALRHIFKLPIFGLGVWYFISQLFSGTFFAFILYISYVQKLLF